MRTLIVAVGRLRPPYQDDVQHYRKMLARYAHVEAIELRDEEKVSGRIPEDAFKVLLHSDGEQMDSVKFAGFIDERRHSGRDLCFVIGGPRGLDLDACDLKLSFGRMTLPHQLARVVLIEQIYRAHKIIAREPYHY
ncbi:MAG TPA: 23S rRNA (pseudouridine(1915)-N(3))-methyltransferase RlmH [Thermoleophilaceae bacterium]|jgi:23S rRNA (pseudouridine1915-N3)-methyltransferase|nr:23S rRNA (pseudouridine(1915)-N(3))-methyltransferase RlmH [Thermoleophilaceae bacterium]